MCAFRRFGQRSTRTPIVRLPATSSGEEEHESRDVVAGEPCSGEWLSRLGAGFDGSDELALYEEGCIVSTTHWWLLGPGCCPESSLSLWLRTVAGSKPGRHPIAATSVDGGGGALSVARPLLLQQHRRFELTEQRVNGTIHYLNAGLPISWWIRDSVTRLRFQAHALLMVNSLS